MNGLDIAIIAVMAVAAFMGLRIGIIKAVLSLAGLIIGVLLAGSYYTSFSGQLTFISQANVAKVVAFAIILIGVMVIASMLAWFLKKVASIMMLGWVNRAGGAVFGLVLGAIFCSALLAIWGKFLGVEGAIAESGLAAILLDRLPMVLALLPEEFDTVRPFFQ